MDNKKATDIKRNEKDLEKELLEQIEEISKVSCMKCDVN